MAFKHLVILCSGTAGQHGDNLGSDEKEIIVLTVIVLNATSNQITALHRQIVQPENEDQPLSEISRETTGVTDEYLRSAPLLQPALQRIDEFLKTNISDETGEETCFVTDGQLHLRQVLHPEACNKCIELPHLYFSFFDLRKHFEKCYNRSEIYSVNTMLEFLSIQADSSTDPITREAQDMVKITQKMIQDGYRFDEPEIVSNRLEPGICGKNEEVDNSCVVRARGLPWQSSDQDIARFFRGLDIAKGGVALCLSSQGRRNGEALVRFINQEHRDMALKRHKHHIGQRYIEVYKASGEDFVNVAGGNNNEAQSFLSRGGQVIVRMRGLPYDCTAKQVVEFFDTGENKCCVMDGDEGVLFVKKPDGRATGDAFVMFETEDDASKALGKHRESIGARYIELFRITNAEVQQVLKQSQDPRTYEQPTPLIQTLPPQVPLIPQPFITSGTRKDCIRLRGLPYEAQVEHILEFLGDHSKMIVFQGVHMVYNAQGQPSGEAFIQMDSEHSAFVAAQQRHHKYMVFGKKQRYIEVFQVSGEDMNLVLTGGIPTQRQPLVTPASGTLFPGPYGPIYSYMSTPHPAPQMLPTISPLARGPTSSPYYPQLFYWPYPSPPVSPTTGYYGHTTAASPATPALVGNF